jgi:hypothetical protein
MLDAREESVISGIMPSWNLAGTPPNSPDANRVSSKLTYLRQYITDMAYVSLYATHETRKKFKKRIYEVPLRLAYNESTPKEIRIVRIFPGTISERVWKHLHASKVTETIKLTWYVPG